MRPKSSRQFNSIIVMCTHKCIFRRIFFWFGSVWLWFGLSYIVFKIRFFSSFFFFNVESAHSFIYFTLISVLHCFCLWFILKFQIGNYTPFFWSSFKRMNTGFYFFFKANGYQFEWALIAVVSLTKFKHLSLWI